jgi:hypothetical protein
VEHLGRSYAALLLFPHLLVVPPLAGWRDARVTEIKTSVNRAHPMRRVVGDPRRF